MRGDNGKEFLNDKVKELLIHHSTGHQTSVAYTPQQNGRAEREMRTIVTLHRDLLINPNETKSKRVILEYLILRRVKLQNLRKI